MQARTRVFRLIATVLLNLVAADLSAEEPAECSARNSERATVAQIAANPDAYEGRCVAVDGTMQGSSIFESVDGVYLQPPDSLNPASSGLRIGLDNSHYSEGYRGVSILGRVQDCETVRNCAQASAGENEIVMISGYCHTFNGPYLWVHDLRYRRGQPFYRRMGSDARSNYGNLVAAPDQWWYRAKIASLASEFLLALQTNDRNKLADIHFRNVGEDDEDEEAAMLRFLLKDRQSPFFKIRTATTPPQQIILVERWELKEEESEEEYFATVCYCREKDCTGRWPIATFDADNLRTRPYACTQIEPYLTDKHLVPHFTTNIGNTGLAEPAAHVAPDRP